MNPWTSLGTPVLLSAVLVFIASSIGQAVLPFHRNDFRKLPGESEVMDTFRRLGVSRGDYLFPRPASRTELASPAFREKYKQGPAGLVTVLPKGGLPMARTFVFWFAYCVAVSAFAGFLASRSLPAGASRRAVFVLVAAAAFGGHVLALWPATIWYGKSLSTTVTSSVDGAVYGVLTGAAFAWLWPR